MFCVVLMRTSLIRIVEAWMGDAKLLEAGTDGVQREAVYLSTKQCTRRPIAGSDARLGSRDWVK